MRAATRARLSPAERFQGLTACPWRFARTLPRQGASWPAERRRLRGDEELRVCDAIWRLLWSLRAVGMPGRHRVDA
jgi:hypothetical protein